MQVKPCRELLLKTIIKRLNYRGLLVYWGKKINKIKTMSKEQLIEDLCNKAMADCDTKLAEFRQTNAAFITACIQTNSFDDLIKILFKGGFLAGMRFGNGSKVVNIPEL